jgi:hypothetical protein
MKIQTERKIAHAIANRQPRTLDTDTIIDRIQTSSTPMIVIKNTDGRGLDCFFIGTVVGEMLKDAPNVVGIFDRHTPTGELHSTLIKAEAGTL